METTVEVSERPKCPSCASDRVWKAGKSEDKQLFVCRDCGRNFREFLRDYPDLVRTKIEVPRKEVHCGHCGSVVHVPLDFVDREVWCSRCFELSRSVNCSPKFWFRLWQDSIKKDSVLSKVFLISNNIVEVT